MSITTKEIVDRVVVVAPTVRTFSGRVINDAAVISDDEAAVLTPGSLKVCDPDGLKIFHTLKQAAVRACRAAGVSFLNGYAVPTDKADLLLNVLAPIAKRFDAEKQELLQQYPSMVDKWAIAHPSKEAAIRARAPAVDAVDRALSFGIGVFKIDPQPVVVGVQDAVEVEAQGLIGQLAWEISQEIVHSWRPTGAVAGQRAKNVLYKVAEKARGLAFLDHRVAGICTLIDNTIIDLPESGKIEGNDFLVLGGLMAILSDPKQILAGLPEEVEVTQIGQDSLFGTAPEIGQAAKQEVIAVDQTDQGLDANDPIITAMPMSSAHEQRSAYAW
jgi:hypothetical protein